MKEQYVPITASSMRLTKLVSLYSDILEKPIELLEPIYWQSAAKSYK